MSTEIKSGMQINTEKAWIFERSGQEQCGMHGIMAGDSLSSCSKDRKALLRQGKRLMIQEELRYMQTDPGFMNVMSIPVNGSCLILLNL
jgi:hypothetical protein